MATDSATWAWTCHVRMALPSLGVHWSFTTSYLVLKVHPKVLFLMMTMTLFLPLEGINRGTSCSAVLLMSLQKTSHFKIDLTKMSLSAKSKITIILESQIIPTFHPAIPFYAHA
jgi:hypothetical protein